MNRSKRRAGVMISVVAERYGVHPQTLRLYEREGLLRPGRSDGNTRLYDEEAIQRLETILTLTRDMGVNLAGVEVILTLRDQLQQLRGERDQLVQALDQHTRDQRIGIRRQTALVRITAAPLVQTRSGPTRSASDQNPKGGRRR
jgi:MerR family transcriptional regulator/heat shock protein HspR